MIARLLIFLLVLPSLAYAQFPVSPNARTESGLRTGQWTILYDSAFLHEVTDPDSAVYYRLVRFENGKPSGKVRDFYRSGQKQWDGYMTSINPDKMDGECRHYYQNGKVNIITNYKNGVADGPYAEYSAKGELTTEGQYENNESVGKWTFYFPSGKKAGEHTRVHGLEDGLYVLWFESGQVSLKGMMTAGNREGIWERYFETGKLQWKSNYLHGKFDGFSEEYYDNGQLKEKGECRNGFYDGFWTHYHDTGKKESEGKYVLGNKSGLWKEFNANGILDAEMMMTNGKKNGSYTGYYESGKASARGFYENGHYTGKWIFLTEDGLPKSEGEYYDTDSLQGVWSYYHKNGKLKATGLYERGFRSGKWSYYYETGILKSQENFIHGELQGEVTQFYEDGPISDRKNYDQGKKHGVFESYYSTGKIKSKSGYDHDVKDGEWITYYGDGKLDDRTGYVKGVLDGPYEANYKSGNSLELGVYKLGDKVGTWKKFYADGTLSRIDKYENGKFTWILYHPNGQKKYEGQGTGNGFNNKEEGYKKEYYANGNLRVEGKKLAGVAEGLYVFYDSITGKKETEGNFLHGEYDGVWKFYTSKGKLEKKLYYIKGFLESVTNVRDSVDNLIDVKDYDAATTKLEWFKKVLKRDEPKGSINWTSVYRLQGDIYYNLDKNEEALKSYQQYEQEVKKIEGDSTHRYRLALNGLANTYSAMKQYDQSLKINEQLCALSVRDPNNYPTYLYNKAIDLYKLKRADEGERELIKLWHEYESKFGADHTHTLRALKYVAYFQGDFLDKHVPAIEAYKYICAHVPENNELYLIGLRKLSLRYIDLDSTAQSNVWLQKAVDYQIQHGLDKYKIYFDDVTRLAEQYFQLHQYSPAGDALVQGISALSKAGGIETFQGAKLLSVASKIFTSLNYEITLSTEYAEKAKTILEKLGNQDTYLYEEVLSQLASAHFGNPLTNRQAEKYFKQLIQLSARKYGATSNSYYTQVIVLANYYNAGFRLAKSDSVLKTISDIKVRFDSTSRLVALYERILGDLNHFQYRYSDALEHYKASAVICEKLDGPVSKTNAQGILNQAATLGLWGKKAEAETMTRSAMEIYEKLGEVKIPEYFGIQERLAALLCDQFLYAEGESLYKTVIQSTLEFYGEDHENYRNLLLTLGALQVKMGEYKKAEQSLNRVATLALKNPDGANEQNYFRALQELASLKALQKDNEAALVYFNKARIAAAYYPEDIWNYIFLKHYAKFCSENSRYTLAENLLLEALAIAKRVNGEEHSFYATIASELANVYQQLGKNAEAEKMISVALAFAEKNKKENEESYIETVKTLALNMRRMGRYEDSEKLYNQILKLVAVKDPNTNRQAVELIDMASLQLDWKRYDRVIDFLTPSLRIMKENLAEDHENIPIAYNQLGLAYLELGKLDSAYYLFKFCIDKRNANGKAASFAYATTLHNLGNTLMRQGKFAEAEASYQQSFATRKKYNMESNLQTQITLIDDYGMLYQAWGKQELAEKYWKEALDKSLKYIGENFSFLSDYEKAKFWERNKADFEYFNTFAALREKTNPSITGDMYNYRLATKGILLSASNKLRKRIYASRDSLLINQYYQWIELRELAAKEYANARSDQKTPHLDSLEKSINALEKELSINAEDNAAQREQRITWKAIQQTLGADEAAVELIRFRYFDRHVTDSVVYAALIITRETKANPELIILKNGEYLESKAYKYYRNCILNQVEDDLSYASFWQPIDAAVKNKKRIYISLDGVFNQISLKTLRLSDGSFLMDKRDFITVSNTRDLVALKARKKLRLSETASLIGNPKFYANPAANQNRDVEDRGRISDLPGTKVEIESVENLLTAKGWKVNAFVQQDATEDQIKKLPTSRIVHLATHGFFQDSQAQSWSGEDPMLRSGVLLTGAADFLKNGNETDGEDGILTAYEAANLSFEGTELVVLSACETARGEIKQGEGVYGLQRAFITAGAESLVMSLWKVDDVATQKLMSLFYQNLMQGMEKSEALTQAQRELKKQYPNPFYWGAFVMMRG